MNSSPTFISYAHEPESRAVARALATRLRRDGVPVWLDEWELQPGEEWQSKVKAALEESKIVLAIVSKSSLEPEWLQSELKDALAENKVVIPVLNEKAGFNDIPECLKDRQAVAPLDDDHAYQQLLKALRISDSAPDDGDDIDNLSFLQRLLKYAANAA